MIIFSISLFLVLYLGFFLVARGVGLWFVENIGLIDFYGCCVGSVNGGCE